MMESAQIPNRTFLKFLDYLFEQTTHLYYCFILFLLEQLAIDSLVLVRLRLLKRELEQHIVIPNEVKVTFIQTFVESKS